MVISLLQEYGKSQLILRNNISLKRNAWQKWQHKMLRIVTTDADIGAVLAQGHLKHNSGICKIRHYLTFYFKMIISDQNSCAETPESHTNKVTNRGSSGSATPMFCKVKLLFLSMESRGFGQRHVKAVSG